MSPIPRIHRGAEFETYFFTMTVIEWIDVFTKPIYFQILADSFSYCVENKGLILYEFVFMTNHIHFIARSGHDQIGLEEIIRDFKKYTTKKIWEEVQKDSRTYIKNLLRNSFSKKQQCSKQIWQTGNFPEVISSEWFRDQKVEYIWHNPVRREYVNFPEEWRYSSARQRSGVVLSDIPLVCAEWEE